LEFIWKNSSGTQKIPRSRLSSDWCKT